MNRELVTAMDAAHAAGAILRAGFGQSHDIQSKGPIDVVTEMDRAAETRIVELLRSVFPEHGFLTEESGRVSGRSDERWIIDPLDGTVNYARGNPRFCVSIAFERAGELEIGVIYDPLRDELFAAHRGGGATCNGKRLTVSTVRSLKTAVVSTGFPYDAWTSSHDNALEVAFFVKRVMGLRSTGSAALDLAAVACGRCDAHWESGLAAYDLAAGTLVVREAGGRVTDYAGHGSVVSSEEILAANPVLHDEMLAYLKTRHRERRVS